jgi:hypothetical protein
MVSDDNFSLIQRTLLRNSRCSSNGTAVGNCRRPT